MRFDMEGILGGLTKRQAAGATFNTHYKLLPIPAAWTGLLCAESDDRGGAWIKRREKWLRPLVEADQYFEGLPRTVIV